MEFLDTILYEVIDICPFRESVSEPNQVFDLFWIDLSVSKIVLQMIDHKIPRMVLCIMSIFTNPFPEFRLLLLVDNTVNANPSQQP